MHSIILAFALAQAVNPALEPAVYAETFCNLRQAGVSYDDAMAGAVSASNNPYRERRYITVNGKQQGADIVEALYLARRRCPKLL